MKQLWNEICHIKELTAVFALIFGFCLSLAGFIVDPKGVVDDSVLWILGQCLIYAGSIYGISTHFQKKQVELENKIDKRLNKKNQKEDDDIFE